MSGINIDNSISEIDINGLTIWERPIDSLKHSLSIWSFAEELTIKYYNVKTRLFSNILKYKYEINNKQKLITILLENDGQNKLTFKYTSVSTGAYVVLTKQVLKKK